MNAVSSNPPGPGTPSEGVATLPRTFGRYTLFEQIGKGGMAQIYLARAETELGATRLAVVKQILPAFADDPRFADMLIHEAKLAARLGHRRIAQVFDLGRENEHLYIAMEYVEGFDLNSLLRQCTEQKVALPAQHALGIVADVLEGLDYAHRRDDESGKPLGIVHRDVSPSNVLISYEGEVKLCDFGIAHANDLVKEESASEALKGKAGYMSPEHARGESLDARADVFAAGIILWELLAGRRLYKPKSDIPLVEQAQAADIPTLPDKGVPKHADLEKIVRRALAKDREERYASAGAMLRDLEAYLADSGMLASRLKLGEWIATSFGTELIEKRRASERRLPKSVPPPRSSERVRAAGASPTASSASIPAAPATPRGLEIPVSNGAIRAFKKELESNSRVTHEPGSLAGAAMDVSPSSRNPIIEVAAAATPSGTALDDAHPEAPLVARKKGNTAAAVVTFAVVLAIAAALVALARFFVQ
ncbi:MAG: serine/threonine protein kinase [Labilithrix sp.]|nr:serine/threonine protein kinase [Labilithrix sp.]